MDCADEAGWRDMEGHAVFKALKVSVAILNLIRAWIGSQWSLLRVDELESWSLLLTKSKDLK